MVLLNGSTSAELRFLSAVLSACYRECDRQGRDDDNLPRDEYVEIIQRTARACFVSQERCGRIIAIFDQPVFSRGA